MYVADITDLSELHAIRRELTKALADPKRRGLAREQYEWDLQDVNERIVELEAGA